VGEDPEQLERQIEETRAKLGADIDALEEKVNPKKVAHRSVENAKDKAAGVKDKVVGAVGAAKDKITPDGTGSGDSAGTAKDKAADAAGTAKEKATALVGTVQEKAAPLVGTVQEKAAPLVGTVQEKAGPVAGNAWHTVQDQTRENPLLIGGIAFAIGFLLGR
jgi:ElaB/YqjD/DUF883 family membrane-anchored ribosome-binding protein